MEKEWMMWSFGFTGNDILCVKGLHLKYIFMGL